MLIEGRIGTRAGSEHYGQYDKKIVWHGTGRTGTERLAGWKITVRSQKTSGKEQGFYPGGR